MRAKLFAECLGTLLLLATVVGSGIMGTALSGGNDGLALLANAAATAGILYVLIALLGPVSGAHFNPAVTLAMALRRELPAGEATAYIVVQVAGAIAGVVLAHACRAAAAVGRTSQARERRRRTRRRPARRCTPWPRLQAARDATPSRA